MNPAFTIKVLAADDQPSSQQAIRLSLKDCETITVAGTAVNGADLLEKLPALKPDVVIMDINMPVMDGVQATRLARELYPDLKILAYTIFDEEDRIIEMMDAGASGYVLKSAGSVSLIQGIAAVMEGGTYYCSSASETLIHILKRHTHSNAAAAALFTETEKAILQLICRQQTTRQIAAALFMSVKTAERHRTILFAKARVKNVAGLVAYAYKNGLYRPEDEGVKPES